MFAKPPDLVLKLKKNLRRSVLRGEPWIYAGALAERPRAADAVLARLDDAKGHFLAWVFYDSQSPLAARVLSLEKSPPTLAFFEERLLSALKLRSPLLTGDTNSVRLIHGEGDLLPGLVLDKYAQVGVLQTDGPGPRQLWCRPEFLELIQKHAPFDTLVEKPRREKSGTGPAQELTLLFGEKPPEEIPILENGVQFFVSPARGQKTGFFLDQRDNRQYSGPWCQNKKVLNVFSYTGGFSVYAGKGGASHVTSLDISKGAVETSHRNWQLNGLPQEAHHALAADAFKFLKESSGNWDVIFVDPPSMARSAAQKELALRKYTELFTQATLRLRPCGDLFLSSCTSQVSQIDFLNVIEEALSAARAKGRYLRISSQGPDHPFPHAKREMQYLKFAHLKVSR